MTRPHLPPAPGVVRAVLRYITPDGEQLNTVYWFKESPWSAVDLVTCASAILNWESTVGCNLRAQSVFMVEVVLTDLTTPTSGMRALAPASPIQGNDHGEYLPGNVTLAVTFTTGQRGTGRQGRMFWIGLTENMVEGSTVPPSTVSNIHDALSTLRHDVSGSVSCSLVILHRIQDGVTLNPAVPEPVLDFAVRDFTTDSQVNRLPGRSRPSHRR